MFKNWKKHLKKKSELGSLMKTPSFRVCVNCGSIRVYPYMGFMVGQRYQCQDCDEIIVIPLEFDNNEDYQAFLDDMGFSKPDWTSMQKRRAFVIETVAKCLWLQILREEYAEIQVIVNRSNYDFNDLLNELSGISERGTYFDAN